MRLVVQVALSVAVIYGVLWQSDVAPDLAHYLFPWLDIIRSRGHLAAFATPFTNYSPPYLYLLSVTSLIGLGPLATVKLISVSGTLFLASAVWRLMRVAAPHAASEAALFTLLLPTVAINGPMLGQCDAIWAGLCVLAVAAALEKRVLGMAAWAGLAFAFKAQAAFLAPFALIVVARDRKWVAVPIGLAVYLLALAPAWMIGWPLGDLLTIYVRQADFPNFGNAPNLWALPSLLIDARNPPQSLVVGGYLTGICGVLFYLRKWPQPTLAAALLSTLLVPFLLPKMHERFFFVADVLALCMAFADRRFVRVCVAVQLGSLLAYLDYFTALPFRLAGSLCMAYALMLSNRLTRPLPSSSNPPIGEPARIAI